MAQPQSFAFLAGMMKINLTAITASLLLVSAPIGGAAAQTSVTPLPAKPAAPAATRPPLHVPAPPNLAVKPPPASVDQGDIPAAPLSELPPERMATATGPEPARLPAERSMLVYAAGAEILPAGTDAVLADIVARLKARPSERLELRSYASFRADRPTDGRRVALLRARALRDRLVQSGLDPLRLLVFAEGSPPPENNGADAPPTDRVDLVIRP